MFCIQRHSSDVDRAISEDLTIKEIFSPVSFMSHGILLLTSESQIRHTDDFSPYPWLCPHQIDLF